jgi:uncharacterized protein YkwD
MKHIFRVLVIVIIIATFPIWKDKAISVYDKVHSYISGISKNSDLVNNEIGSNVPVDQISEDNISDKQIDTPGALRVVDSFFNLNTRLSIKGIIEITNKERASFGLPPLVENTKLDRSALAKVNDMFDNQYFEHISPSGVGVSDLALDYGYDYIIIGENLALGGFKDDQAVVTAWMNSPGHRANILNTRYTNIGVSVGRGSFEGRDVWIAVQHFGLPKYACPSIDSNLKASIDSMQSKIKALQKELDVLKAQIDSTTTDQSIKSEAIKKYNDLVNTFNSMISNVKVSIDKYNTQVRAFNECVKG